MSVFTRLSRSPDEAVEEPGVGEGDEAARISGWGWQDGMRPSPDAPVWPMDAFRDRFLSAFGSRQVPSGSS